MVGSARACLGGFSGTGAIRAGRSSRCGCVSGRWGPPEPSSPRPSLPVPSCSSQAEGQVACCPLVSCSQKWPPQVGLVTGAFLPLPQMAKERW